MGTTIDVQPVTVTPKNFENILQKIANNEKIEIWGGNHFVQWFQFNCKIKQWFF